MSVVIKTEHLHLSFPMRTRIELALSKLATLLPQDANIRLSLRFDARETYEGMLSVHAGDRDLTCVEFGPNLIQLVNNLHKRLITRIAPEDSATPEAI